MVPPRGGRRGPARRRRRRPQRALEPGRGRRGCSGRGPRCRLGAFPLHGRRRRRGLRGRAARKGGSRLLGRPLGHRPLHVRRLQPHAPLQRLDRLRRPRLGRGLALQGDAQGVLPLRRLRLLRQAPGRGGPGRGLQARLRLGQRLLGAERAHGAGDGQGHICRGGRALPARVDLRGQRGALHAPRARVQPLERFARRDGQRGAPRAHARGRRRGRGARRRAHLPLLGAEPGALRAR